MARIREVTLERYRVQLTRGSDYGARGVLHLARMPSNSVVLVGDIASAEGLPESYLAKIFQDLAKGGIVRSHREGVGPRAEQRALHV